MQEFRIAAHPDRRQHIQAGSSNAHRLLASTACTPALKPSHTLELAAHHTSAISEHLMPASTSGAAYAKVPAQ